MCINEKYSIYIYGMQPIETNLHFTILPYK